MYLTLFGLLSEPTLDEFKKLRKNDSKFREASENIVWSQTALSSADK
jgi:hypothetical protein